MLIYMTLQNKVTSMELQHALSQIADIRRQMNLSRRFRGVRAATTFTTGLAAIASAGWEWWEMPQGENDPMQFIALWVIVAAVCIGVCAIEITWRYCTTDSNSQRELTRTVAEQFLPFVVTGGLLTLVVCRYANDLAWTLPGLWEILFGLGLFSLRRLYPESISFVGAFYVLFGLLNLSGAFGHYSPWGMGMVFGAGQAACAVILYWYLERSDAA
jgi:hypothetical protein